MKIQFQVVLLLWKIASFVNPSGFCAWLPYMGLMFCCASLYWIVLSAIHDIILTHLDIPIYGYVAVEH